MDLVLGAGLQGQHHPDDPANRVGVLSLELLQSRLFGPMVIVVRSKSWAEGATPFVKSHYFGTRVGEVH